MCVGVREREREREGEREGERERERSIVSLQEKQSASCLKNVHAQQKLLN